MRQVENIYLKGVEQRRELTFLENVICGMEHIVDSKFAPVARKLRHSVEVLRASMYDKSNSSLSKLMQEEDRRRDRLLQEVCEVMQKEAAVNQDVAEAVNAALGSRLLPEPDKTLAIDSFLDKLCDMVKMDRLEKSGAYELMAELCRANRSHGDLFRVNEMEMSGRLITRSVAHARELAEHDYMEAVRFINAMLIYNGDDEYANEVDYVNDAIRSLNYGEEIPELRIQEVA
jgi:hypothetical protein